MRSDFAFVCDYADATGKINALGIGFDTIYSNTVPARHELFYFVVQFRASVVESGNKTLKILLIDEDGQTIMPEITLPLTIRPPVASTESTARVSVAIRNATFPRYGRYSLRAAIDDIEYVDVTINVAQPPQTT